MCVCVRRGDGITKTVRCEAVLRERQRKLLASLCGFERIAERLNCADDPALEWQSLGSRL